MLSRLRLRTAEFHATADVSDPKTLRAFRCRHEHHSPKLVGELPNCPFVGLVGAGRFGCLVHPLQNGGVDGRDCGVYDRHTCDDYLCAAHSVLRPIEKWLVIAACPDSYTYGLVITDPRFVRELLEQTAQTNAAMPSDASVRRAGSAASAYFSLKRDWAYRAADGILGQLHGSAGLQTPRRKGPAERLGVAPDRWETILRCLGTCVDDLESLCAARDAVRRAVDEFADACRVAP